MELKDAQIWCENNMPNSKIIDLDYKTIGSTSTKKYCFVLVKCLLNESHKVKWKRFTSFKKQKFGCKECSDLLNVSSGKRIEYEDVEDYIINNTNFELLTPKEKYKNSKQKIKLRCKCENKVIEYISLEKIKYYNKIECYNCTIKNLDKKWNKETIKEYLDTINYKFLDMTRTDYKLKVKVKCPNEKHTEYWVDWASIYNNKSECRLCYYENENKIVWDNEKIIEFFRINNLKVLNIETWKNTDSRLKCLGEDGFYYNTSIHNITKNNKYKHNNSIFKNNPYALENVNIILKEKRPDYKCVSVKYKGYKARYEFEYLGDYLDENINPKFYTSIDSMIGEKHVEHPFINMSKGEKRITIFLEKNNIKFDPEYKHETCINPKTNYQLRFDFAILDDNNNVKKLLEFDGQGHYDEISFWGGKDKLIEYKYRDKLKNIWAKNEKIPTLRISYLDFNRIEEILTKELLQKEAIV